MPHVLERDPLGAQRTWAARAMFSKGQVLFSGVGGGVLFLGLLEGPWKDIRKSMKHWNRKVAVSLLVVEQEIERVLGSVSHLSFFWRALLYTSLIKTPWEIKGMEAFWGQEHESPHVCNSTVSSCWQHAGECVFSSPGWELQVFLTALCGPSWVSAELAVPLLPTDPGGGVAGKRGPVFSCEDDNFTSFPFLFLRLGYLSFPHLLPESEISIPLLLPNFLCLFS